MYVGNNTKFRVFNTYASSDYFYFEMFGLFLCITDVDECDSWGSYCPQQCLNVKGSYKCHCQRGFLDTGSKGLECKAEGEYFVLENIVFGI